MTQYRFCTLCVKSENLPQLSDMTYGCLYHRCPNLLSLTMSGCGHITDRDVISVLQCCRKLRYLHLENCVRITDCSLEGVVAHGDNMEEVKLDFCRNITQAGLQHCKEMKPALQLTAERSADLIPDSKPEERVPIRRTLQKVLQNSWLTGTIKEHSCNLLCNDSTVMFCMICI